MFVSKKIFRMFITSFATVSLFAQVTFAMPDSVRYQQRTSKTEQKMKNFKKALKGANTPEEYVGVLKIAHEENINEIKTALAKADDRSINKVYDIVEKQYHLKDRRTQKLFQDLGYQDSFEARPFLNAFADGDFLAKIRKETLSFLKKDGNFEKLKSGYFSQAQPVANRTTAADSASCAILDLAVVSGFFIITIPLAILFVIVAYPIAAIEKIFGDKENALDVNCPNW